MANSAAPDQLASSTDLDLHSLQSQDISGFSRTRVNVIERWKWSFSFQQETSPAEDNLPTWYMNLLTKGEESNEN